MNTTQSRILLCTMAWTIVIVGTILGMLWAVGQTKTSEPPPLPAAQTITPATSPMPAPKAEPDVEELTRELLNAAIPEIESTAQMYLKDGAYKVDPVDVSTNIEKTSSLTTPLIGYVYVFYRCEFPKDHPREWGSRRWRLGFAYQDERWVYKSAHIVDSTY